MLWCPNCQMYYNGLHFCPTLNLPAKVLPLLPPLTGDDTNKVDGGGLRYDGGKLRYDLIPTQLLEHLASVYTYGANKYADWNWARGIKWSRVVGSMFRHFVKFMQGERLDPESGLPHLAHMFWNAGTLLFYSEVPGYEQFDDRYKGGTVAVSST